MSVQDHYAIQRLKRKYCYMIDDDDYEEWVTLFTQDSRFVVNGGKTSKGHEELHAFTTEGFDNSYNHTAHIITSPVIDTNNDAQPAGGTSCSSTGTPRGTRGGSSRGTTMSAGV